MTILDMLLLRRLGSRIGIAVFGAFGIISLVDLLNTWRFEHLVSIGGPFLGIMGIVTNAGIWTIKTLPVTLLLGAILGLLDLQARREMTVILASGISIWRLARAPLLAVIVGGAALVLAGDTAIVLSMRALSISPPQTTAASGNALWLEQRGNSLDYVLLAQHPHPGGQILESVTFFLPRELGGPRIEAPLAELRDGHWFIERGVRFAPDTAPQRIANLEVPTQAGRDDMRARLASPEELTVFELLQVRNLRASDPGLRSGLEMRLMRLFALPLTLAASVIIALAFTAGYRRTNKYGSAVLYGIVLGFVVYLVTEMAATAGSAGIIQPALAAFAPAFVAIVIGTTVLLFREDGQR